MPFPPIYTLIGLQFGNFLLHTGTKGQRISKAIFLETPLPKKTNEISDKICFLNPDLLAEYDETIKTGLENILNGKMTDQIWDQASLPTKLGGFGIRKTTELAISGYLSFVSAVDRE